MKITIQLALIAVLATFLCPACGGREPATNPTDSGANQTQKPAETAKAPETLADAMALAKKEGKNLLVEYTSRKCAFCKQMNAQTLTRDDVTDILGLINEAYDEGVITGFVTAFNAD